MELTEAATAHDVPVLRVAGDVDLSTSERLRAAVESLIARGTQLVVVDLGGVTFFDSAGLKVLDEVQQHAATSGTQVALACPQNRIVKLLQITGLDHRFTIHETPEGAAQLAVGDD